MWMPAHLSLAEVGEAKLSDGVRLTTVDWRANRLADALAKAAARRRLPYRGIDSLLAVAAKAARHAARLLGRVTHSANNHTVMEIGPDGVLVSRVVRDVAPLVRPRHTLRPARELWGQEAVQGQGGAPTLGRAEGALPSPLQIRGPTAIPEPLLGRSSSVPERRLGRAVVPPTWLANVRAQLRPATGPTAASRLDALRACVRARSAASS